MNEESKDKVIELFREAAGNLAQSLAEMHANMLILCNALDETGLTPIQQSMVNAARKRLTENQNAFLKEFGDYAEPGVN